MNTATATPLLHPNERYAGPVLDEAGQIKHHLILLPARPDCRLNWQDAKAWAASVGGDLPNPQEQLLLLANCRDALPRGLCWSDKEYEGDASFAWLCNFLSGNRTFYLKSSEGSAVAVRRSILESFDSFDAPQHSQMEAA